VIQREKKRNCDASTRASKRSKIWAKVNSPRAAHAAPRSAAPAQSAIGEEQPALFKTTRVLR